LSAAILCISSLYGALILLLYFQLQRLFSGSTSPPALEPPVSVIIAIRNEAPHLEACLHSLAALDYSAEKLEIILIDDASSDGSDKLLQRFCTEHPRMRTIRLNHTEKELPGKAGAIYAGIKECHGEIIFVTDADCRVPSGWIRYLLEAFNDQVGLVGGFTLLQPLKVEEGGKSRFAAVQALDWLFLLGIAAAAIRLGKPVSWMGNNMAFRRSAYDEVGGYPALGHSLIEDFALLNAISRKTRWKVHITAAKEAAVISLPVENLVALYNQRRRWALGIQQVRPFGKLLMITSFVSHFGATVGLFCCIKAGLAAMMLLMAGDFMFCRKMTRETQSKSLLRQFLAFEAFYFAYSLALPLLMILDRRIRWKGQSFPAR
jgi:1,2-diacylglycerol 3-beta-glucosyltransferase